MNGGDAKILVVDDNDDNRYTLTMGLELQGYKASSRRSTGTGRLKPLMAANSILFCSTS